VLSAEDPKTRSVLCEVCHTKKPGLAVDSALNRISHPLDLSPGEQMKMPEKWADGKKVVLGTGGELVCRTCHIPHGAADKKKLLVEPNYRDSLCVQCHREKKEIAGTSHYLKVLDPNEKNINGDPISVLGPCSPCHLVHQGAGILMWARKTKQDPAKPGQVCLSCHCIGGAAEKVMPAEFSHPMDIALPQKNPFSSLPLFDEKGKNYKGKIRCGTCHDFHNPYPYYEDTEQKDVKNAKFLRLTEYGASGICINCHPRQGLIEGTEHDLRISAPDSVNALGQPLAPGDICSACHMTHNKSRQRYLWSALLGPTRIQGWKQAYTTDKSLMTMLCTGCHSPGRIAETEVPHFGLHPREKMVEGMPGIDFDLVKDEFPIFTDAGEIAESGNIVCSTCHDPHQWDPYVEEKGPGGSVDGDVTNSFLRPDLKSKFCTGCHGKDILIKFTYFHSDMGRQKKEAPFSFK
jgi:predicted CXXCH cytochrome family protein